jgi:dipeptidyl aminopeptidase/acylaminoacyl peptidase
MAPASAAPVTLQSIRNLVGITGVSISPDAASVAFVRSISDYQRDKNVRTVMLVSTKGGPPKTLTKPGDEFASLQWSPSGTRLAYIGNGPRRIKQVFVVSLADDTVVQLTHTRKSVLQYAWSPSGTQIAYVTEDGPVDPAAAKRHDDLWEVHDDGFLTKYQPRPAHIWLIPSEGGTARRLTEGSWSYLEAPPPFAGAATNPTWSADGRTIAFTMQANADNSDSDLTSIAKVDVRTGKISKVDSRTSYEYEPSFAPRGDELAYIYPHGPGPASVMDVWISSGAQNADVTQSFDHNVTRVAWLPQNRLLMLTSEGIDSVLYVQSPGGVPRRVSLGRLNPHEISTAKNGAIAMIASASDVPPEIYVMDSVTATPRTLTNLNAKVASLEFGRSEEVTWKTSDGQRADGILTYPVGYQPGKKYPLVLRIHGGPVGASVRRFMSLRQLFAARGYLVFEPNYRGSDDLGTAYEHAIFKDTGKGPGEDVMAGVEAIEKSGIVDTTREAVTGHSYGGYMTAWLIGHYHNWRSAVIGDGVFDWVEAYDLSNTGNLAMTRDLLGGSPWNPSNAAIYHDQSPISYVHDIKTPTRIITGTADDQAPSVESFALYHALRDMGVPVSFIAIPDAMHNARDPVHIEGYNRVTMEWVERYMR